MTLASNNHYFYAGSWASYGSQPLPLVGMSYEYLCHVSIPGALGSQYCSLANFQTTFANLENNLNTVVRVNATFNSSPGIQDSNPNPQGQGFVPFQDEQIYPWFYSNPSLGTIYWDLSQTDQTFLNNLERVVCSAYQHGLVVEVTLFDPWNPTWASSPFNPSNTKPGAGQGFTGSSTGQYFADMSTDTPINQNGTTRGYQKAGVVQIVSRLRKYPNVIWEVANEPDLMAPGPVANVVQWENTVVQWIQQNDSVPPHLIMINGHSPAPASFAWAVQEATDRSFIETAHYTSIHSSPDEGAIDIMRDPNLAAYTSTWALGFSENRSVPDILKINGIYQIDVRKVDDVRAEAWEFVLGGGGLFNGYSYNMSYTDPTRDPQVVSAELYQLMELLYAPGKRYWPLIDLNTAQPASCNKTGDWCFGLPTWGQPDLNGTGGCANTANAYWSAISSANNYLIYIHHGTTLNAVYNGQASVIYDGFHELPCGNGSNSGFLTPLEVSIPTTGCLQVVWLDPRTGTVLSNTTIPLTGGAPPVPVPTTPLYKDDVAVVLAYWQGCGS